VVPKFLRVIVFTVVLVFCVERAVAADFDVVAGASVTVHNLWTDAEFLDAGASVADDGQVHWSPVATLGHIGAVQTAYHRDRLDREIWVAGAGVKLSGWWRGAFVSEQLGATSRRDDALSSTWQFVTTLGWQTDRFVAFVRHVSNAKLFGGKNLGETMFMVGVGF
jgi:hypothetical protein